MKTKRDGSHVTDPLTLGPGDETGHGAERGPLAGRGLLPNAPIVLTARVTAR